MADTTCGNCGRLGHMVAASGVHKIPMNGGTTRQAVYKCLNCKRLNLASEFHWGMPEDGVTNEDIANGMRWDSATWLPRRTESREFEDVPEHIAQTATEATLCLSVGAYRAVGSLARAVIEATAKDKGAQGRDLRLGIDALRDADHIREHTKGQAHQVRHFGDGMAHGDFVEPTAKEEAEEVIDLMAEVLDEVYRSPARLQRRRDARLAKKAADK